MRKPGSQANIFVGALFRILFSVVLVYHAHTHTSRQVRHGERKSRRHSKNGDNRSAFAQRRKTLVNSLESTFGGTFSKDELKKIVTDCGYNVMTRGETLDISGFAAIAREIGKKIR